MFMKHLRFMRLIAIFIVAVVTAWGGAVLRSSLSEHTTGQRRVLPV